MLSVSVCNYARTKFLVEAGMRRACTKGTCKTLFPNVWVWLSRELVLVLLPNSLSLGVVQVHVVVSSFWNRELGGAKGRRIRKSRRMLVRVQVYQLFC